MIPQPTLLAILIFGLIVAATLGLSFYMGAKAQSAQGYFAASGEIPWFVNGLAFAGDYLSAASFLGICGMIAFYGYDGFLYSIGYLAGWVVALFVIAEPLKRLGKYTFADALDSQFQSRGIKLAASISTLAVSIFYLIPQMVGAGVLIKPLLGFPHEVGVLLVGGVVITIVVTAGMVSTTWVQFLKGSLLLVFSTVMTVLILVRGFEVQPLDSMADALGTSASEVVQTITRTADGKTIVNGLPQGLGEGETDLLPVGHLSQLPGGVERTGPLGPLQFFRVFQQSSVIVWDDEVSRDSDGSTTRTFRPREMSGSDLLTPGNHPSLRGLRSDNVFAKLNFISLMLALFCGTASLPHILIRYYTVKDQAAARKSTIVGIASIGFFYVLTLYMGLGAMTSGALDVTNSNMAAPLLARSISELLFAVISAIAFTTVLGTVSGLIIAASGAVAHDIVGSVLRLDVNDYNKVRIGKLTAIVVGIIAVVLGILFQNMNVNYLVGWAFSIAASANLPALVMLLFWKRTSHQGISVAIVVGMVSSLAWILLSGDTYRDVYGLPAEEAIVPFSQPGIVTIPLGFATLIVVSLLTPNRKGGPTA